MPKVIRPYFGDAAYGKNGKSPSSLIYARTSSECESTKMVTYTKSYKAPIQPDSALQLSSRDKLRQLILSLKNFNTLYKAGSLYGTYPVAESTFVSDRSRYISLCMRLGLHFLVKYGNVDLSEDKMKFQLLSDDLFADFFSYTDIIYAIQIRGDQTNQYFYRSTDKFSFTDLDGSAEYLSRDVHYNSSLFDYTVDASDFEGDKTYYGRIWFSFSDFPPPPENPLHDATTTWDIGNSVRLDFPFILIP